MDCLEIQEFITASVDGELSEENNRRLHEHIAKCAQCRTELHLERATKLFITKNLKRVSAPALLRDRIINGAVGPSPVTRLIPNRGTGMRFQPAWRWVLPLGGGAAALLLLLLFIITPSASHHPHTHPVDSDIVHQTYNNFDGVLDGKIVPDITSEDPGVVRNFFHNAINFPINIPRMKHYKLVGGVCTQYKRQAIAHLVYRNDHVVIYLCQAKFQDVLDGKALQLSPQALAELQRTGWYSENHTPDCSFVMWVADSTICCAIADIKKDQLLASLNENE